MDFKNIVKHKVFKITISAIAVFIIVLFIFQAGMFIGYRKAAFSYQGGDNYYRTFAGHHDGRMIGLLFDRGLSNDHGTIGKIIKVSLPVVVIADQDGTEKIVDIDDDTEIRRFRETIGPADLVVGNYAVVIGSPNNNAHIDAKLIRLIPPLPHRLTGTTTQSQ